MIPVVRVAPRGAARWRRGHPWIYRSDVDDVELPAGVVAVSGPRGRPLGHALWSPRSEIRLRRLTSDQTAIDRAWWTRRVREAAERRRGAAVDATAFRVVHAEADGLPSLVVDRYGDIVVAQLLSAGLEACRTDILAAVEEVLRPRGVLLRHDVTVRRHEGLSHAVEVAAGSVPETVEVREGEVRYLVTPRDGQKTGAFLDQRVNRVMMGARARGRALDLFSYEGLFAVHMGRRAERVEAVEGSGVALARARRNAELNGVATIDWIQANAFDLLRDRSPSDARYDTIVLDPPAFAKRRAALRRALAGYKEINLRAMRLLAPGGLLLTCSCSFHVDRSAFVQMLRAAAADAGRSLALEALVGPGGDHPEIITIPETAYLKGALLRALD